MCSTYIIGTVTRQILYPSLNQIHTSRIHIKLDKNLSKLLLTIVEFAAAAAVVIQCADNFETFSIHRYYSLI